MLRRSNSAPCADFFASVLVASGHLVTTEEGDVALVRATPARHQEVAKMPAVEGRTWNHPALSDGFLVVRNSTQMAAIDLRPRSDHLTGK